MKTGKNGIVPLLIMVISLGAAALTGILSRGGSGSYLYPSIRGEDITIYGQGIYRHMSSDVAIQGIAQDWITLCLAVPVLLVSLLLLPMGIVSDLFMARAGENVVPVIFIMPTIAFVSLVFAVLLLRSISPRMK